MKAATRILTLVGLSLMTGASIGAGPAQAATSADQAPARPATASVQDRPHDDEEVVGFFRNRWACERAGRIGEMRDRWDDYDCERVGFGFRRGFWMLEVERDRDWRDRDWRDRDHDHDWDDDRDGRDRHRGGDDDNRR